MKPVCALTLPMLVLCLVAQIGLAARPGEGFFTNRSSQRFEIRLTEENLASLRREPREYVPAVVVAGGKLFTNVGIHLKGVATFRQVDDKPSLTLNFAKFQPKQRFHGLRKLHLNNGKEDPSFICEAISAEMFAAAGLPVARVTHAQASLNGRELGAFVAIEGFTEDFVGIHFTNTRGNLYDSGFRRDIDQQLEKLLGKKPHDWADLRALAAAARVAGPSERWSRLARVIDTNNFARYLAMQVLTANWDGYAMYINNYRLYHDPASDRIFFMPHGMDQMFARPSMPLLPQWEGMVARAFTSTLPGRNLYQHELGVLFTNVFHTTQLTNRVAELGARVRPLLVSPYDISATQHDRLVQQMRFQVAQRGRFLKQQLELGNWSTPRRRPAFEE